MGRLTWKCLLNIVLSVCPKFGKLKKEDFFVLFVGQLSGSREMMFVGKGQILGFFDFLFNPLRKRIVIFSRQKGM